MMPIRYGKVVGRIITIRGDGTDVDRTPDVVGDTNVKPKFTPVLGSFVSSELGAIATPRVQECTVDADGVMRDEQGGDGVWLLAGTYNVSGVPLVKKVVVTEAHTDVAPLDLVSAVDYVPPAGTTVQTVVVPSGAAEGQVLAWVSGSLGWVDAAEGGTGTATTWDTLEGKPATFPPAAHTHPEYVNPDLSGYVTGSDPRLSDARTPTAHTHPWAEVTGKPTTFTPSAHTHSIANVTGLQTALDGKQPAGSYLTEVNYGTIPAGSVLAVFWTGSAWPARPTARTDVAVDWTDHTGTSTAPAGAVAGVDRYTVVDPA